MGKIRLPSRRRIIPYNSKHSIPHLMSPSPQSSVDDSPWIISIRQEINQARQYEKSSNWKTQSIYRIPKILCEVDETAYTPQILSIGPYHRRNPRLYEMNTHKWRALYHFLDRTGQDIRIYLDAVRYLETRARRCYEASLNISSDEFVKILVVDSIFLIEIFRGIADQKFPTDYDPHDPVFSIRINIYSLLPDMLLLENQIPLFILDRILGLQLGSDQPGLFAKLALHFFQPFSLNEDKKFDSSGSSIIQALHCLDLFRHSLLNQKPSSEPNSPPNTPQPSTFQPNTSQPNTPQPSTSQPNTLQPNTSQPSTPQPSTPQPNTLQPNTSQPNTSQPSTSQPNTPQPSTSQPNTSQPNTPQPNTLQPNTPQPNTLQPNTTQPNTTQPNTTQPNTTQPNTTQPNTSQPNTAQPGILKHFEFYSLLDEFLSSMEKLLNPPLQIIHCVDELRNAGIKFQLRRSDQFWDIKFNNGVLQIPHICIQKSTKSLFLNLIAFEFSHLECTKHITAYVVFMDNLINSELDVKYLLDKGIIKHWLGNDKEVADMFNQLTNKVDFDINGCYLADLSKEVNIYYNKRWNTWRANLIHKHLSNPWTIISLAAAIALLLFTFAQTFYSIYGYYKPK